LVNGAVLQEVIERVPKDFHLSNIALSVLLKKERRLRHCYIPIRFRERYGGEPSVAIAQFGSKALELINSLKSIK